MRGPCAMLQERNWLGQRLYFERNLITKDLEAKLERLRCHEEANVYTAKEGESKKKDKMLTRNEEGEENKGEKGKKCLQRHYIF